MDPVLILTPLPSTQQLLRAIPDFTSPDPFWENGGDCWGRDYYYHSYKNTQQCHNGPGKLTLLFQGVWCSAIIKGKFQWASVVAGRAQSKTVLSLDVLSCFTQKMKMQPAVTVQFKWGAQFQRQKKIFCTWKSASLLPCTLPSLHHLD